MGHLGAARGMLMVAGYFVYRLFSNKVVFDRRKDSIYYEGDDSKSPTRLSSVHAIQIIPAYRANPDVSGYSFEVNLVLNNGERINVMNHGNGKAIDRDTQILGGFLSVPVWEVSRNAG